MDGLKKEIYNALSKLPILDVHTHVDAMHLSARGLHDILLYHMVISDLYSAGCPNGARLSENPPEEEITFRLEQAIPYIKFIQNTSCFWGVRIILKDLYEWDKPITLENWREIHEIIKKKSQESAWPREILRKAGIKRISTELWRRHDGRADDVMQYSLEWAFFARMQWKQYDTALLELENAWNQDIPEPPLPVTLGSTQLNLKKRIHTVGDVKEAMKHYFTVIPYDFVLSTAQHLSTDINYTTVTDEEMAEALSRRGKAGAGERDIYASYVLELFLTELEKRADKVVFQFSFGAEPLPYETGSKLRSDSVFQLAEIIQRHPGLHFQVNLSSAHQNQAICTLVRELPNVSLTAYWWHNFFPAIIRRVMAERLDMVAASKQIGFFSDAYCVDWTYAKAVIVKKQMAEVYAEKIEHGQYTLEQALGIAGQVLYDTPKTLVRMEDGSY